MSDKIDDVYNKLDSKASNYYCGSACFLSLIPLCEHYSRESDEELKETFSSLGEACERLSHEDADLFRLSREDELSTESWDEVSEIMSDYLIVLENLTDIVSVTADKKVRRAFCDSLVFISKLCQNNCAHFFSLENVPPQVMSLMNSCLAEIRRDHEKD